MAKREKKDDVVLRGTKMRIYPTDRQVTLMDMWRRRCISLWNLLLDLETAAYGAKNTRSKLGWRSVWARVVEENHAKALIVYQHGKCKKDGSFVLKRDGTVKHPPRERFPGDRKILLGLFDALRHTLDKGAKCKCNVNQPYALTRAWLDETGHGARTADILAWLIAHGGTCDCKIVEEAANHCPGPRLFIWEHELAMIMARLKAEPRTGGLGALRSHAAQTVVKDLVKALQTMLKERAKAAAGDESARKTGF